MAIGLESNTRRAQPTEQKALSAGEDGSRLSEARLRRGGICLDLDRFTVHAGDRRVHLTPLEFDVLAYLMRHAHRVVSHEELVRNALHGIYDPDSSRLRVHVTHLRRKLGTRALAIETVRGRGFRFV
jgi:two-component system OmpR family response regulator